MSLHHSTSNISSFAIEIYKVKNNIPTSIMSELFEKNLKYDLCSQTDFSLHRINTIVNVLKSLEYFAGKVWNIVPFEISNAACLEEFSTKIKS